MDPRRLFKKLAAFEGLLLLVVVVNDLCFKIVGASRSGCLNPLGLESKEIANSQISSYTHHKSWDPHKARLNNENKAWCSDSNIKGEEYLEIDLLKVQHISAIGTQGASGRFAIWGTYYVNTFEIKYSFDGTTWFSYERSTGSVQTFTGNSDAYSVVHNYFRDTFVTRFIRIYPQTYYNDMCMRVELYGCSNQTDDCSTFQTNASGSINSLNYPASYPPNKQCTWLISVPGSKNIALIFTQFDVSQSSNPGNCSDDYVEVRNGLTDTSPVIGGKLCNRNRKMLITTRSNVARIYFHTGTANLSHRGFLIYFLSVTQGSDDVLSTTACDGEVLALTCSGYHNTINILHAWYQIGSYPFSCGQRHNSNASSCQAFNAMNEVVSRCQDYKECFISVSGSSFGQSCSGVRRQLEVFYQCTSTNIKSHTTKSSIQINATEAPIAPSAPSPSQTDSNDGTDVVLPNRTSSAASAGPPVERISNGMTTGTVVGVIVVVIAVVISLLLIALFVFRKKRQRKEREDKLSAVKFTKETKHSKAENGLRRYSLNYSGIGNSYETTNILYQSADSFSDQANGKIEDGNAYASCPVRGGSMKVTENPLYAKVSPQNGKVLNGKVLNGKVEYEIFVLVKAVGEESGSSENTSGTNIPSFTYEINNLLIYTVSKESEKEDGENYQSVLLAVINKVFDRSGIHGIIINSRILEVFRKKISCLEKAVKKARLNPHLKGVKVLQIHHSSRRRPFITPTTRKPYLLQVQRTTNMLFLRLMVVSHKARSVMCEATNFLKNWN
ncbi:uncharacterized protein [Montipora foliosa]|uniref:uncharacterized protein isoform X3 n=1 Tax=Montipora foliosa TaxID=591990 RepID=UPI0035F15864